jgi:hypothetical protein
MDIKQEKVKVIFENYQAGNINQDMLIQQLNELQDSGVITQEDREVLGWMFIFKFKKRKTEAVDKIPSSE